MPSRKEVMTYITILVVMGVLMKLTGMWYDSAAYAHTYTSKKYGLLSNYGVGDGLMGGRTSCGKTVKPTSMYVAALDSSLAHCGLKVTIYFRGKKYHTKIQDRGSFHIGRSLDAAPGLRSKMGFTGVVHVGYKTGWR